uniref:Uncharacterized protein n=1 Tax=Arundo donax TaxID=35708 RepID=A0A0A9C6H3_ARUDO
MDSIGLDSVGPRAASSLGLKAVPLVGTFCSVSSLLSLSVLSRFTSTVSSEDWSSFCCNSSGETSTKANFLEASMFQPHLPLPKFQRLPLQ